MKDPLLQTYSFEELLYEFHSIQEEKKAALEISEAENDKIEEDKERKAQEWADKMEAEEAAQEEAANQLVDPAKDPKNIAWMEEQIKKEKERFGEDFGEDFELNFNE